MSFQFEKKEEILFTVCAMDNLDHNSSFITAESSSHKTGINIVQFPTSDSDGCYQTGEASSVSCSLPHSYTMVPALSLLILCVETLGRINPILWPHFMPLLDVTVHLCSLESLRNQHGKPGIPSLKSMMFILHNINNPYDAVDLKKTLFFCLLKHYYHIIWQKPWNQWMKSIRFFFWQNSKSLQNLPPTMVSG